MSDGHAVKHGLKSVHEAVLHCAAIKTGQFDGKSAEWMRDEIRRWHRQRGFVTIGYHFLIAPGGSWIPCRPVSAVGAHVAGHNVGTIGILLIESREITRVASFETWFTPEQKEALRNLLRACPYITRVKGHNDYANKLCPGFRVDQRQFLG